VTILEPGSPAPAIDLATDTGGRFRLADHAGRSVLIYFYPDSDTPACNAVNFGFSAHTEALGARGITVVGIAPDSVETLAAFRAKYTLLPILASDPDRAVIMAYGAWGEKQNYGRTYTGLIRTTVLVGPDGRIVHMWRNIRAKGHADRVYKALTE